MSEEKKPEVKPETKPEEAKKPEVKHEASPMLMAPPSQGGPKSYKLPNGTVVKHS